MRQLEFEKLKPGDIVYNPSKPDDVYTVMVYQPRMETFLLVRGRQKINLGTELLWFFMARLPDYNCLWLADFFNKEICRIYDPKYWEKNVKNFHLEAPTIN